MAFLFCLGGVAVWLLGRGDGDSQATSAEIVSGPSTTARQGTDDFEAAPIDIATLPPNPSELDSLVETTEASSRAETTTSQRSTTTTGATTSQPEVTVTEPFALMNLVGQTQSQAESQLAAAGLTFETSSRASLAAASQVLSTTPSGGSNVEPGATISIVVSSGPPCVLPDLVGLTVARMAAALSASGCPAAKQALVESDLRPNTVVSANLVETSAGVDVVARISQPDGASCPNGAQLRSLVNGLVGKADAAARAEIQQAGCTVGSVSDRPGPAADVGNVISASASGERISLTVGSAACDVPAVAGRTVAAARLAIRAAGCTGKIAVNPSGSPASAVVLSINPRAGASIGAASTITLTADDGEVLPPTSTTTTPTTTPTTVTPTTPTTEVSTTVVPTTPTTATSTTATTATSTTTTTTTNRSSVTPTSELPATLVTDPAPPSSQVSALGA
ncbi:MAG: PASTA domain-containing protein [Acidimicrobiales bacterium]